MYKMMIPVNITCLHACICTKSHQSCLTTCDPKEYNPHGRMAKVAKGATSKSFHHR